MNRLIPIALLTLGCLAAQPSLAAQKVRLDPGDGAWKTSGEVTAGIVDGRSALRLRSGRAIRSGLELRDGTVEFDLKMTPHRSFVYVQFRLEDERNYEEIYFRPHKTRLPDAVQYTPVYNGVSNWQLFHREGATAAATFSEGWTHFRLEFKDRLAALFVGESAEPQLVIPLHRTPAAGAIAVRAFLPGGQPENIDAAVYSNLVVKPGETTFDFSKVEAPPQAPAGVVTAWEISEAFVSEPGPLDTPPALSGKWKTLQADASGLLVFDQQLTRPQGSRRVSVAARLQIQAQTAGPRRFNLGFSDEVTVFLNGQPLLYDTDSYSFNFPRRQGLIGLDQTTLFLPLNEGDNELLVVVSESFGGWGLMGQLAASDGVRITSGR